MLNNDPFIHNCIVGNVDYVQKKLSKKIDLHSKKRGSNALCESCFNQRLKITKLLLQTDIDINSQDSAGFTPLTMACTVSNSRIVKLLLDHGAAVDGGNGDNYTALHKAVICSDLSLIQYMLTFHPNVHIRNDFNETVWDCAKKKHRNYRTEETKHILKLIREFSQNFPEVRNINLLEMKQFVYKCGEGDVDYVTTAIHAGAYIEDSTKRGCTALYSACVNSRLKIVKLLLQHNVDVNGFSAGALKSFSTPLIACCSSGERQLVSLLVRNGADVSVKGGCGRTALIEACIRGDPKIVLLLLRHGADIDCSDGRGMTPLMHACSMDHEGVAVLLLDEGADYSVRNKGRTALEMAQMRERSKVVGRMMLWMEYNAVDEEEEEYDIETFVYRCKTNDIEYVRRAIQHGVDINTADRYGQTGLYNACMNYHLEIVRLLLENDVEINKQNETRRGWTPLIIATYRSLSDLIVLLLDNDADINQTELQGRTPLWRASRDNNSEIVQLLLEYGADCNISDNSNKTPLDIAKKYRLTNVVETLEEWIRKYQR